MVEWTTPAKSDLREIHDYIARDSKFYAQKVTQTIVSRSEKLNDFPETGRIVPEIGDHSIREVFVYSYRLIYEISPNGDRSLLWFIVNETSHRAILMSCGNDIARPVTKTPERYCLTRAAWETAQDLHGFILNWPRISADVHGCI